MDNGSYRLSPNVMQILRNLINEDRIDFPYNEAIEEYEIHVNEMDAYELVKEYSGYYPESDDELQDGLREILNHLVDSYEEQKDGSEDV